MSSKQADRRTRSRGAVLRNPGDRTGYKVEDFDLDPPAAGEVLVRLVAAGLCHTDDHVDTGDMQSSFRPILGGHEGAGVVVEVGPGVTELRPDDHVVITPPACGTCPTCARGHSGLCDLSDRIFEGPNLVDGRYRRWIDGDTPLGAFVQLGTFATYAVVSLASVVKIDPGIPLMRAAVVGCAVMTGWGAAVYTADTRPGDVVVVVGIGGVGICAVQGARMAGASAIVAVDRDPWKRERAPEFGATHVAADFDEARELVGGLTKGKMAQRAVLTVSVASGSVLDDTVALTGKSGVTALVAVPVKDLGAIPLDVASIVAQEKQIRGSILGSANARFDIPRLLQHCEDGELLLDELITRRYSLDQIADGYRDLHAGGQFRSQIVFD